MRQCIFVVGSREQLQELVPLLDVAKRSGLRHSIWITAETDEPIDALTAGMQLSTSVVKPARAAPRSAIARLLYWLPTTMYRCYHYVHGVRTWTTKTPLVLLHGDSLSTSLASHAGRWGGGQLVHLQHTPASPAPRSSVLRRLRFAFCGADVAADRSRRNPGCTVVGIDVNDAASTQEIVDKLLRWTGGRSEDG